jgi:hypothetical protein
MNGNFYSIILMRTSWRQRHNRLGKMSQRRKLRRRRSFGKTETEVQDMSHRMEEY